MTHAKFGSPSTLYRSEACPGWVAYCDGLPVPPESEAAAEGTTFHAYMEKAFALWLTHGDRAFVMIDQLLETCAYPDMAHYVVDTVRKVSEFVSPARSMCDVRLEMKVKVNDLIYGTADVVIVTKHLDDTVYLHVVDYKYGMGVRVRAEENLQGLAYVLGAAKTLGIEYDKIVGVEFTIAQVRLDDGWTTARYTGEELAAHESRIVRIVDRVKAVWSGWYPVQSNLHAGPHCRFCPADGRCVAQQRALSEAVDDSLTELPVEDLAKHLTIDEQVQIFKKKKQIEHFLDAVATDLQRRLELETHPEVKIVETNGRRRWKDSTTPEDLIKIGAKDPVTWKLRGIGEIEKQIGKGKIDALVEISGVKREVVLSSDKREAVNGAIALTELPEE